MVMESFHPDLISLAQKNGFEGAVCGKLVAFNDEVVEWIQPGAASLTAGYAPLGFLSH